MKNAMKISGMIMICLLSSLIIYEALYLNIFLIQADCENPISRGVPFIYEFSGDLCFNSSHIAKSNFVALFLDVIFWISLIFLGVSSLMSLIERKKRLRKQTDS